MILSICYPTYNRGNQAYEKVTELLQSPYCYNVQIVVSNNCSNKNTEGYEKISKINDVRLKYYKADANYDFYGNVNRVILLADSDFCLLLSDEDHVVVENLPYYMEFLESHKLDLAVMKVSGLQYVYDETRYYNRGVEAVEAFYMVGNYLSGVIYNKRYATEELLKRLTEKYIPAKNIAYLYYPHMMIDAELLVMGGFAHGSLPLVREGQPVPTDYFQDLTRTYASVDDRIDQMKGFMVQVEDIRTTDAVRMKMLQQLLIKTVLLCSNVKEAYLKRGYDWNEQLGIISRAMHDMVSNSKAAIFIKYQDLLLEYVDSLLACI